MSVVCLARRPTGGFDSSDVTHIAGGVIAGITNQRELHLGVEVRRLGGGLIQKKEESPVVNVVNTARKICLGEMILFY